jgi:hypothetical protein
MGGRFDMAAHFDNSIQAHQLKESADSFKIGLSNRAGKSAGHDVKIHKPFPGFTDQNKLPPSPLAPLICPNADHVNRGSKRRARTI